MWGTVSTIMQTVQQTQQTEQYTLDTNSTPTEHCQQLLPVVATDSEEESGTCNSLDITQHQDNSLAITQQNNSLDITQQNITQPEQTNITHTATYIYIYTLHQLSQTQHRLLLSQIIPDKVTGFHHIMHNLFLTSIVGEEDEHIHKLKNKERKHKKKDDN